MTAKQFLSVSAVRSKQELESIVRIRDRTKIKTPIAIGFQVSEKSINTGGTNNRQAPFGELPDLVKQANDWGLIPAIHYYSKNPDGFIGADLQKMADSGLFGYKPILFQFNTLPPNPLLLAGLQKEGVDVIFKVAVADKTNEATPIVWRDGRNVVDVNTGDVNLLVQQVRDNFDFISYAMFDPSHGTDYKVDLNEERMGIKFGKAIITEPELDRIGLVYAGGISHRNVVKVVKTLSSYFGDRFSIDAESGLRDMGGLNMNKVRCYLENSADILES